MAGAQRLPLAGLARGARQLAHDVHSFQRWARSGVWKRLFEAGQDEAALRPLLVNGRTSTPAGRAKEGPASPRAQPRRADHQGPCSGRCVRPLAVVSAHGRPASRRAAGVAVARGPRPGLLIAGRGYDSDPLVADRVRRGTKALIPPRRQRRHPRPHDAGRYAQRHPVERLVSRLK